MKKKVLFTATVDSHILHFHVPYLKLFKEKGYEVHVATNGDAKIPYCDVKHKISFERSPYKLNNLKAIKQLRKIVDEENFEIIHTHTPMGSVVTRLASIKARKKGTRVIYTAHGFHFYKGASKLNWLLFYPVEKILSRYTDCLITINKEDYELAKSKFKKCKQIEYVPGVGIDEEKFDFKMTTKEKNDLRKSLGLKKDDFVLIYPAELSERKRQEWLINTLNNLMTKHNDIHLLLPGKDSLNGRLSDLIVELKLEKQVHLLGYRSDIPKLLYISDIAVSSARQEGLPVNIMEAMYVGLPIVASDCRGNRDLVKNNKNGYLIDLDDSKNFSKKVEKLYKDKEKYKEFEKYNKKEIEQYRLVNIVKTMKKIYIFNQKKKIAIITSGFLPVPATKGGAAENLIDTIIEKNEQYERINPTIFSVYDEEAYNISKKYEKTNFIFIKPNKLALIIDSLIYLIIDKILKIKNSRKFRFIFQRFDFFYKCSVYLKRNNYDKILLENHTIMYLALKWNKNYVKYKNNYYYHCHNVIPSKYGMEKIINNTRKFISVSCFRNNYVKEFFNVENEKCCVVLNCCSKDIYYEATNEEIRTLKDKYSITNEKVILYIGRIDKDKGTLELVKACNNLKNNNFKLLIVGAPIFATGITTEYEKKVRAFTNMNKEKIIMTGYVNHNELYKYYAIANLVVIPSQVEDSAPLVLLESLVCGKPIIATECGGIPEYVNKNCARLIKNDSRYIDNLTKSIEEILSNSNLEKSMSQESKKRSKLYNDDLYYDNFINHLLD